MGKQGDLWDDSALLKAFDTAFSKYKTMHGIGDLNKGKMADDGAVESFPASEAISESKDFGLNTEVGQSDDKTYDIQETAIRVDETAKLLKMKEIHPLELPSSTNHAGTSNGQKEPSPASENPSTELGIPGKHTLSFDSKHQNEAACYSNGQEEYNQLLNKYNEIEDQRQKLLMQLNLYNDWYYQNPEQYQTYTPQPYNSVTCNCSYGCQNWVVPCDSFPTSCLDGPCTDKNCHGSFKDQKVNSKSQVQQDQDFVQTAMTAAKTALSSLTQEAFGDADTLACEVQGNDFGADMGNVTKSTDLAVVLNAWYSAGFYTGKYLSEQSLEKKRQG